MSIFQKKDSTNETLNRLLLGGEDDMLYQALILLAGNKRRLCIIDGTSGRIVGSSATNKDEFISIIKLGAALYDKNMLEEGELEPTSLYDKRLLHKLSYGHSEYLYLLEESDGKRDLEDKTIELLSLISYIFCYRNIESKGYRKTKPDLLRLIREIDCENKFLTFIKICKFNELYKEKGVDKGELLFDSIFKSINDKYRQCFEIAHDTIGFISTGPSSPLRDAVSILIEELTNEYNTKFKACIIQIEELHPENSVYTAEISIENADNEQVIYLRNTNIPYTKDYDGASTPFKDKEKDIVDIKGDSSNGAEIDEEGGNEVFDEISEIEEYYKADVP